MAQLQRCYVTLTQRRPVPSSATLQIVKRCQGAGPSLMALSATLIAVLAGGRSAFRADVNHFLVQKVPTSSCTRTCVEQVTPCLLLYQGLEVGPNGDLGANAVFLAWCQLEAFRWSLGGVCRASARGFRPPFKFAR